MLSSTRGGVTGCQATTIAKVATVIFVGCLAGCAAGSCLSYGHSCWGAHGKRSGAGSGGGADVGLQDTRWFISRLAPVPSRAQTDPAQWFAKSPSDTDEEQRRNIGETSVIIPADPEFTAADEPSDTDREVIVMEQPPRLFKIFNHYGNKLDLKSPVKK